jgi:hypothetical protein
MPPKRYPKPSVQHNVENLRNGRIVTPLNCSGTELYNHLMFVTTGIKAPEMKATTSASIPPQEKSLDKQTN